MVFLDTVVTPGNDSLVDKDGHLIRTGSIWVP